jgi:uncharacterized protein (TIGR03437 family)
MEQTGTILKLARTQVYRQQIQGAAVISRLGRSLLVLVCASTVALGQTGQQPGITSITSAANAAAGLAPESLGTAMGTDLAAGTASAQSVPWPTTLGGVTVQVTDAAPTPVTRLAGLLFVSPSQINFQVPAGTAPGTATVTINNGQQTISSQVEIRSVAPGLFSVNAQGDAAATGIRVAIPTQQQSPIAVVFCVDPAAGCHLVPIDLGVDTPVYLSFYGTGFRGRSSLENVAITIGNMTMQVTAQAIYAGPQPQIPGLDQLNILLPLTLRGAGVVSVTVSVDGTKSNPVLIQVM